MCPGTPEVSVTLVTLSSSSSGKAPRCPWFPHGGRRTSAKEQRGPRVKAWRKLGASVLSLCSPWVPGRMPAPTPTCQPMVLAAPRGQQPASPEGKGKGRALEENAESTKRFTLRISATRRPNWKRPRMQEMPKSRKMSCCIDCLKKKTNSSLESKLRANKNGRLLRHRGQGPPPRPHAAPPTERRRTIDAPSHAGL